MGEAPNELVQCRGRDCRGAAPKLRSRFYPDKRAENGLMPTCKVCHRASVERYRHSAKGRLVERRRRVLQKQAMAALRSGALGQVYPCEFTDGNCAGDVEAYFPDEAEPEEYFWFCTHHRGLVRRLKTRPSHEKLLQLIDRWT